MILGAFSFSSGSNAVITVEHIRKVTNSEGLIFHPVVCGGFSGGYYLQPRLPWTAIDNYHFDEASEILVLVSGSVYNKSELYYLLNITEPVSDPELIANLFLLEGPGFVKKLNGDFTIFLLKRAKKEAYLFRDHVGIRPLAWTTEGESLYFSSDIIGLCRAFSGSQTINSKYLLGYFKYIDYRNTPNIHVKKLLPGHFLHFTESGIEITKYWHPEKIRIDRKMPYERMLSDLKNIVQEAVRIRCDNRFTAGAHVSSGIDSGIVSALVRKEYSLQDNFYGLSWSPMHSAPRDVKFDEREIVKKSCKKVNIIPLFSDMSRTDFPRIVSSLYNNHGYFAEDKTIEQAVGAKVNLIFSGWGGDEFISTGDRAIELDLLLGLKFLTFFRRNPVIPLKKFIKNQLHFVLFPALGIMARGTARSFRDDARYIKKPFKKSDRKALRDFYFHTSRHQLHLRYLHFYHLQDRCENWAINGFRKGVEYRYPLLDWRIIEYMLKVPSELLGRTNYFRPILREISEGILPEEVRWHNSKNDPVYWANMLELFKSSAILFMEEVDAWASNPDLDFIDFDVLTEDIRKYKEHSDELDEKVLFRALVYIKAIQEFTIAYRK